MHASRVVIFGQSCSGKTTFAKNMTTHNYCCFDRLFNWHAVETLGLSITSNLIYVRSECDKLDNFVLDGWHLGDKTGVLLPSNSTVYVVYTTYQKIIKQYRVPVYYPEQHRQMFKKWYYDIDYNQFKGCRYFLNLGEFKETTAEDFERWKLENYGFSTT